MSQIQFDGFARFVERNIELAERITKLNPLMTPSIQTPLHIARLVQLNWSLFELSLQAYRAWGAVALTPPAIANKQPR